MSEPEARVIADSVSSNGHRLTTIEVKMHRFVLAEFNTHRVFSRNAASSRAIPIGTMIEQVTQDPAIPLSWPSNQPGMSGGDEIDNPKRRLSERAWREARDNAVQSARYLLGLGVHKSVVNRLLEPFAWARIIVSATDWRGFWQQRCSPLAQPEIRAAAEAMREAYELSNPRMAYLGDWHTPYISEEDYQIMDDRDDLVENRIRERLAVSAARCARVSYLTHDGRRDTEADLRLFKKLVEADPPHYSPLEHVATPGPERIDRRHQSNFSGWIQLRHLIP